MTKRRRTNDECMTVGAPMTVLQISCSGASDKDSQGDFVNACSVERAEGLIFLILLALVLKGMGWCIGGVCEVGTDMLLK